MKGIIIPLPTVYALMSGSRSGTEHGSKANRGRCLTSKASVQVYLGIASWADKGGRSPHKFVVMIQVWVKT